MTTFWENECHRDRVIDNFGLNTNLGREQHPIDVSRGPEIAISISFTIQGWSIIGDEDDEFYDRDENVT